MKVAFLSPGATLGGAELSLLDILASLQSHPDPIALHLVVGQDGPLVARARELGVEVAVLPLPAALARLGDAAGAGKPGISLARVRLTAGLARAMVSVFQYGRVLRRHLSGIAPDVIHANGFKMHVLGARSAPKGVPVVWHIRDYLSSRPFMARALRGLVHRTAMIVTNSKSVAEDVRAVCGPDPRIETIYNALDLQEFSPDGDALDLDQLAGLAPAAPGTVRVGLAGTLALWKGHAVFLQALALLPDELPVRGYIIGDALYRTTGSQFQLAGLRDLAAQLNLSREQIGFTGYTDQPAAALRALDIVVHASTSPEPFGRVVAEAMACGRALVASRGGGVPEIITEGIDALAHSPGDAADLAAKIETLARDAELRARLGLAGRATAEARFDRNRLAAEWLRIYADAAGVGG